MPSLLYQETYQLTPKEKRLVIGIALGVGALVIFNEGQIFTRDFSLENLIPSLWSLIIIGVIGVFLLSTGLTQTNSLEITTDEIIFHEGKQTTKISKTDLTGAQKASFHSSRYSRHAKLADGTTIKNNLVLKPHLPHLTWFIHSGVLIGTRYNKNFFLLSRQPDALSKALKKMGVPPFSPSSVSPTSVSPFSWWNRASAPSSTPSLSPFSTAPNLPSSDPTRFLRHIALWIALTLLPLAFVYYLFQKEQKLAAPQNSSQSVNKK